MLGKLGFSTGVHEEEQAGAVGVFGFAGLEAELAKGGCLLVAEDAGDGDVCQVGVSAYFAEVAGGGADFGEHGHGDAHGFAEFLIPLHGGDVHEEGTGGVGDVGGVYGGVVTLGVGATGEVPQQPGVGGTEEEVAVFGFFTGAVNVIEDPLDLGPGGVGAQRQAGLLLVLVDAVVAGELAADAGGAGVLPDNAVVDGFAGVLVPHDGGFTLVGDAEGDEVGGGEVGVGEGFTDDAADAVPDFHGVVFDPAFLGEDLLEFHLAHGHYLAVMVEDDAAC